MLPCWPFLRAGLGSLMQWVMALSALAAAVVGFLLLSGLNLSGGLDAILGWRPETNVWYAIVPALVALGIVMLNLACGSHDISSYGPQAWFGLPMVVITMVPAMASCRESLF